MEGRTRRGGRRPPDPPSLRERPLRRRPPAPHRRVEAWWIEELVGGRPLSEPFLARTLSREIRQHEGRWPDAPRMPFADYLALLNEVRAQTHATLRAETDPSRVVPIPEGLRHVAPDREGFTVRWIVAHVAQHEAYHGGQATMVKRILTGAVW